MKPFCEPETQTSTPHSSMRKSMEASELHGIDEEQGRVVCLVHGAAHGGNIAGDAGGGLIVGDEHGLVAVAACRP